MQICDSLGCFDPSEIFCYGLFSRSQEVCTSYNSKMFSLRLIGGSNQISDADSNPQTLSLSNHPTAINFGFGLSSFNQILAVFTGMTCTLVVFVGQAESCAAEITGSVLLRE